MYTMSRRSSLHTVYSVSGSLRPGPVCARCSSLDDTLAGTLSRLLQRAMFQRLRPCAEVCDAICSPACRGRMEEDCGVATLDTAVAVIEGGFVV